MIIRNFNYFVKEAIKNLFKNRLMTVASIITVSSTTFILILSYLLGSNLNYMLDNFGNSIGMTIYVNDEITSEQNNEFYDMLLDIDYIDEIVYISKEEALVDFGEMMGDEDALQGLQDDNPLPRSYEITLVSSDYASEAITELSQYVGEDNILSSIRHAQTETEILLSINKSIRNISLILIIGLCFIAIVIIMNTIRMAVNGRSIEINIMKYVGATNSFVRWPFILEGIFIGLVGSAIPLFLSLFTYNDVIHAIYDSFPMMSSDLVFIPASEIFGFLIPFSLGVGVFIGFLGSATSVKKHLNV